LQRGTRADTRRGRHAAEPDSAIARCHDLGGSLRDDCLRDERSRNAGAGDTRAPEPATAPPPQNPR